MDIEKFNEKTGKRVLNAVKKSNQIFFCKGESEFDIQDVNRVRECIADAIGDIKADIEDLEDKLSALEEYTDIEMKDVDDFLDQYDIEDKKAWIASPSIHDLL